MLKIENLNKTFGKKQIFANLDATFEDTGVTLIVGINGVGKTTLLDTILGISKYNSGTIEFNGLSSDQKKFKEQTFYVPSDFFLPEYMTGKEYSNFILKHYPNSNLAFFKKCSEWLGIKDSLNKTLETYSFGMKKKIQLAIMASSGTTLILADEIFNGLDFETTIFVQNLLDKMSQSAKIIIVSHEPSIIDFYSEDIRILNNKKLERMYGTSEAVIEKVKKEGNLNSKLCQMEKYFRTA